MRSETKPLPLIYEGKSKKLYRVDSYKVVIEFKDDVTAYNGKYHDIARGKGIYAAQLSSRLFELLEDSGIRTHYLCYMGENRIMAELHHVLPVEIIVRNYVYGSMARRLPLLKRLSAIVPPLVEYHYKDDGLGDPLLHPRDLVIAGLVSEKELEQLESLALKINTVLAKFWEERGLRLVDFKIEIARTQQGFVVVDEISGDSMRLLDSVGNHYDKEIYRRTRDVNALLKAYQRLVDLAGPPKRRC